MASLRVRISRWWVLSVCLGLVLAGASRVARAQTPENLYVGTTADPGTAATDCTTATNTDCSLRYAITLADTNPGSTIDFSVTGTITLASALPQIMASMTIQGPTSGPGITISGNGAYQVFYVRSGTVAINNLTIELGSFSTSGAGIYNDAGSLTVTNSTFSGNSAGIDGGALYNYAGTLTVINSTFSGNSASSSGGAISSLGTLIVTNSTFSGNSASSSGGAIINVKTSTVTNSTFSGNSASTQGGGIYNDGSTFTENHNLFYNNTGGNASGFTPAATDITAKDPDLLPLAHYGGPTETMLPLPASPAICAGTTTMPTGVTLPTIDQRGFPLKSACVDIGAVQTNYVKATSVSSSYSGLEDVDLTGLSGTVYTTASLNISSGAVNLIGPGANKLSLNASQISGGVPVVQVNVGAQVALYGMTLTGGAYSFGGGIHNVGTLTVLDSTISGNSADGPLPDGGGGINNSGGTVTLLNSTISGNSASGNPGGGIASYGGTLTILNSTISGNAAALGGGIENQSTLTIQNSTISGNSASSGGGGIDTSGSLTLTNTIVSGNTAPTGPDISGSYTYNGGNEVNSSSINLAPLGYYGGPTQTMPPLAGSSALNAGTYKAGEPTTDQRGAPRPSTVGANIDSGSVQISGEPPLVLSVTPHYGLTSGGSTVTITGTGLDGSTAGNTSVNFGAGNPVNATITPASGTTFASITATSPAASAGTVNVTVTNSNGTSATNSNDIFTYETPVAITAVNFNTTVGLTVNQTITVSGGAGSYALAVSGAPPPGLILTPTSTGWTLTGTPTTAGNYSLTLTATDTTLSSNTVSDVLAIDVAKADTSVTLMSSTSNSNLNANLTFTATVTSMTSGTPTGGVEFLDGSTVLGASQLNNQGVATYTTSTLTAGLHKITAVYQGDTNFTGSTSAALAQTVTAPDYSISSTTTNLTLKSGQSGSATISMVPVGGFTGNVQFSCAGLPSGAQCSFSPASLTADGSNTTQTSTLTISTQGSGSVAMLTHPGKPDGIMMAGFFWFSTLFFGGFLFWQRKKLTRKYRFLLILFVALATISGAVGCGSSTPQLNTGTSTVIVQGVSGSSYKVVTLSLKITK